MRLSAFLRRARRIDRTECACCGAWPPGGRSRRCSRRSSPAAAADLDRQLELASVEYQKRNETQEIFIPVGERLGGKVIELRNVSKSFGDRLLVDRLSFSVPPGAIVGIIGPHGAGKSTLFRMLTGSEQPDSGEIEIGDTVRLAYLDQSRDCLDGNTTVCEEISGFLDRICSHILACEGDWQ